MKKTLYDTEKSKNNSKKNQIIENYLNPYSINNVIYIF